MYMNYCRYEGTRQELNVCFRDIEEHVNGNAAYEVSEHEIYHFKKMIVEMHNFMFEMDLLDRYGDLDEDRLEEIAEKMAVSYCEE